MTVYLVDPKGYQGGAQAEAIFPILESKLRDFVTVSVLRGPNSLWGASPTTGDAFVVANPPYEDLPEELADLIERSQENGAVGIPVAGGVERRTPPIGMEMAQSFDVIDRLRLRAQPNTALPVVAADLARVVLTRTTPTMMKDKLRLFLCHRRADGEATAAALDRELSARHEGHVFRDLISIQVGDVAQDKIEEHLESADVLVFLDTPLAGESKWVEAELRTALGRQVPIVWVQLGDTQGRHPLGVRPAGSPHITVDARQLTAEHVGANADRILDAAFELAVEIVRNAHQTFFRVRKAAATLGKSVEVLDQRRLIYALTEDLTLGKGEFPRRPVSDIVQIFGRHPTADDRSGLISWLEENGYGPHDRACRAFDAAVLLDPIARPPDIDADSSVVIAHGSDYLTRLEHGSVVPGAGPDLLLFGAFPSEPGAQEPIKQAVAAVAGGWLGRGGRISFGGHPTFTPMILDIAKRLGDGAPDRVTIFQSAFYVNETFVDLLRAQAKVILVPEGRDRSESLTAMRKQMVEASPYRLVAAIGGRTSENGNHVPGIDEEITIAKSHGLKAVLVAGAGGRVAELASEARATDWADQDHRLTPAEHEWLASTDDYVSVVELLWDSAAR